MSTIRYLARVALAGCGSTLLASTAFAQPSLEARKYNIPTGMTASPLFGAQAFHAEDGDVRGVRHAADAAGRMHELRGLRAAAGLQHRPLNAGKIDSAIKQRLFPMPTREANLSRPNPWQAKIGECIGRTLAHQLYRGPSAGRDVRAPAL